MEEADEEEGDSGMASGEDEEAAPAGAVSATCTAWLLAALPPPQGLQPDPRKHLAPSPKLTTSSAPPRCLPWKSAHLAELPAMAPVEVLRPSDAHGLHWSRAFLQAPVR